MKRAFVTLALVANLSMASDPSDACGVTDALSDVSSGFSCHCAISSHSTSPCVGRLFEVSAKRISRTRRLRKLVVDASV